LIPRESGGERMGLVGRSVHRSASLARASFFLDEYRVALPAEVRSDHRFGHRGD